MTVFLFPGQGSQRKGMGNTLFDEFKEVTARADEILGYSVKELCLHDTHQQLGQTQFTQPALYTVNALICASGKFMPLLEAQQYQASCEADGVGVAPKRRDVCARSSRLLPFALLPQL